MESLQINDWRKNAGLNFILRPKEDLLERSIKIEGSAVTTMSMQELDDIMVALSNYYLFLQSSIGEVASKIQYVGEVLDRKCSEVAAKIHGGHFSERKAVALSKDESLDKMNDKLNEYRSKLEILRPVTDGVRMKLEIIRRIYDRRARER